MPDDLLTTIDGISLVLNPYALHPRGLPLIPRNEEMLALKTIHSHNGHPLSIQLYHGIDVI